MKYLKIALSFLLEIILVGTCWPWRAFIYSNNEYKSFFDLFKIEEVNRVLTNDEFHLAMSLSFAYLSMLLVFAITILILFFFRKKWLASSIFYLIQAICFTIAFSNQPTNFWVIPLVWVIFIFNGLYLYLIRKSYQ